MKNHQVLSKTYSSKIDAFEKAINGARADLKHAGVLLVEMLEENENTFEILVSKCRVKLPFLEALERVGRGELEPELVLDCSPVAARAISQCLSVNDQRRLLNNPLPVAVRENGGVRIVQKRIEEVTQQEGARLIRGGKIQTADQQIEIIKEQEAMRAKKDLNYEVLEDEHRVRFHEGAMFDYRGLMEIASKIAPTADGLEGTIKRNQIK